MTKPSSTESLKAGVLGGSRVARVSVAPPTHASPDHSAMNQSFTSNSSITSPSNVYSLPCFPELQLGSADTSRSHSPNHHHLHHHIGSPPIRSQQQHHTNTKPLEASESGMSGALAVTVFVDRMKYVLKKNAQPANDPFGLDLGGCIHWATHHVQRARSATRKTSLQKSWLCRRKGQQSNHSTPRIHFHTTPRTSEDWVKLAEKLPFDSEAVIGTVTMKQIECFEKSVLLDKHNARAWFGWAIASPIGSIVRIHRFVNGLRIDANHPEVWCLLGEELIGFELFHNHHKHDEFGTSIASSSTTSLSSSLSGQGHCSPLTLNDEPVDAQRCFVECLRRDPKKARAWYLLGKELMDGASVTLDGKTMNQEDCFRKHVELRPGSTIRWNDKGNILRVDPTSTRGIRYSITFEE
eukprot:PhF_6_TR39869/c0_g1_i1/m.59277